MMDSKELLYRDIQESAIPKEETARLLHRLQRTDDPAKRQALRDQIVQGNLKLVLRVTHKYTQPFRSNYLDVFQEGTLGLMEAIDTYDPDRGAFSSHAISWIRRYVYDAVNTNHYVDLPRHLNHKLQAIKSLAPYQLSSKEIAYYTELPEHFVKNVLDFLTPNLSLDDQDSINPECLSIDPELAGNHFSYQEDPELSYISQELFAVIEDALGILPSRDATIVSQKFGLGGRQPKTLRHLGEEFNVTHEGIRQIIHRSLDKVRQYLETKEAV